MAGYTERIKPDHSSIITFVENLDRGDYQIPTFQRDVEWEKENIKKLWDSIFKFYPIGSLLLWKTNSPLEYHRNIGGHVIHYQDRGEYQYLLDGQQRATAIYLSLKGRKGSIAKKEEFDPLLYVDLVCEDNEEDEYPYRSRFLFWDEIDDQNGKIRKNTSRNERFAKGLIVKLNDVYFDYGRLEKTLIDAGYEDYDSIPRKNLRAMGDILKSYLLSFIVLKGIEIKEVCDIFERVNREGKPLDVVDIIVAKTYRPKTDTDGFYLRSHLDKLRADLGGSQYANISDFLLMQILASIVMQQDGTRVLNITNRYLPNIKADEIVEVWSDFVGAFKETVKFLQDRLNLVGPNLVPYGYMYPALVNYFYQNGQSSYEEIKKWFWFTCFNVEDFDSTTKLKNQIIFLNDIKNGKAVSWEPVTIDKNMLRTQSYLARGARSRAILALMAYKGPCEFADQDRDVLHSVYLQLTDRPNLHHFFPINHLENHPDQNVFKNDKNSLMNIVYLTQQENISIRDKNPLRYLQDYMDINPNFEQVLEKHLVPKEMLNWVSDDNKSWGDYDEFIENRIDLIVKNIQDRLKGIPVNVLDSRVV